MSVPHAGLRPPGSASLDNSAKTATDSAVPSSTVAVSLITVGGSFTGVTSIVISPEAVRSLKV